MKKQKIMILKEFLIVQMNHVVLFTVMVTVLGLLGGNRPDILRWGWFGLFPFALFGVRQTFKKLLPFLFIHIILAAGMFFILWPEGMMRVIFIVFLSGYIIYSFFLRLRTEDGVDKTMHPGMAVGIIAVMVLLLHFQGKQEWGGYYVFALIVFLGIYFIYYYINNYQYFLKVNESTASHIPEQEMFHSGIGLAAIYSVFSVAALILVTNIGWIYRIMNQLIQVLKQGLVRILSWLFELLGTDIEPSVEDEITNGQLSPGTESMESMETFWLWGVLEKIFMAAFYCLLIAAAILIFVKLIRFLHERFDGKLKKQASGLDGAGDVREKCEIIRMKSEKKSFFSFLTPRERIRRIYRKRVLEGKEVLIGERDSSMLNTFTARECGRRLEAERLADIYEKARYSDCECTAEDVKEIK